MTLVVALAVLTGRVVWSGYDSLAVGEEALAEGQQLTATVALRESVSWYLPVGPWRERAAQALWTLHTDQLAAGNVADSVRTLHALRGGLRSAQSILRPGEDWLQRVDAALVVLMVRWEREAAAAEGRVDPGPEAARAAWFADTLARDERPARGWGLLAVAGFFLWVWAMMTGLGRSGADRWRRLAIGAGGFVAFLLGVAAA